MVTLKTVSDYKTETAALRKQLALLERQREIVEGDIKFSERDVVFCPFCGEEVEYNDEEKTLSELKSISELECPECKTAFWLRTKIEQKYSTAIYKEALMEDDE